ncbi:hypothetical protein ACGF5M_02545 [Gemmatimonadota bacterium]
MSAGAIMTAVAGVIGNVEFGVVSYMDYPHTYLNPPGCYGNDPTLRQYGGDITAPPYNYDPAFYSPDYAYNLDQSVSSSTTDVANAIAALKLGWGSDGPESYARVFYESYADEDMGWRPGARRILVNFADNIPHDCDLDTGWDPGRDEVLPSPDDLDFDAVLDGMVANNITLINLLSTLYDVPPYPEYDDYKAEWDGWAAYTGGANYMVYPDGTFPGESPATEIAALIEAQVQTINSLTLELCTGDEAYADWLQSVDPAGYVDLNLEAPVEVGFDIVVGPPDGTEDGTYSFAICAIGDGAEYGRQDVTIEVVSTIEATIDIKPGSWPNSINLGTKGKGKAATSGANIAVALFSTADFDATLVDVATVTLGDLTDPDAPVVLKKNGKYQAAAEDVNEDGLMDMVYHFPRATLIDNGDLTEASEYLWLTGIYVDGRDVIGVDAVRVIY